MNQDREETAGNSRTEDTDTGIEDEGEGMTEERTEICARTSLMATHAYTDNQKSPVGKEIDLRQCDTLIFKGEPQRTNIGGKFKTEMDKYDIYLFILDPVGPMVQHVHEKLSRH